MYKKKTKPIFGNHNEGIRLCLVSHKSLNKYQIKGNILISVDKYLDGSNATGSNGLIVA